MSGSIGKALGGLLVQKLAAFQVCNLEEDLFGIGKDLAPKGFEQSFSWIRVIN